MGNSSQADVCDELGLCLWQDCYAVVQGGPEETQALLKNRFDHIFYTGDDFHDRSEVTLATKAMIRIDLIVQAQQCPVL